MTYHMISFESSDSPVKQLNDEYQLAIKKKTGKELAGKTEQSIKILLRHKNTKCRFSKPVS